MLQRIPDERLVMIVHARESTDYIKSFFAGYGIAAERLLFVDDKAENIAAAQARGWQGHVFAGAAGWARALVEAGLLNRQEAGL